VIGISSVLRNCGRSIVFRSIFWRYVFDYLKSLHVLLAYMKKTAYSAVSSFSSSCRTFRSEFFAFVSWSIVALMLMMSSSLFFVRISFQAFN
jgi:hypothetical protein